MSTDIRKELEKLDKDELIELLDAYDTYIQEANDEDRYDEGWKPVCVMEFYDNEFQELYQKI